MAERPENGFLRSLSPPAFDRLADSLRKIDLSLGRRLYHSGDTVEWVYFPENCLISLITATRDGLGVETSMVGSEGAAGMLEAMGSGASTIDWVVQIDGAAWRAPANLCRTLAGADADFTEQAWRMAELQMFESRQSGLCQAMHPVEARFSRWLLESLDRSARRNPLPLTQEFIAAMLGVQRTTVSAFASQLQKEGLITYSRGQLTLVDEPALERRACECRRLVKDERVRLGFRVEPV